MDLFNFFGMFDGLSKIIIYDVDDVDEDEHEPLFCGYITDIPFGIVKDYRLVTQQECRDEKIEGICGVYSNGFVVRVRYNQ